MRTSIIPTLLRLTLLLGMFLASTVWALGEKSYVSNKPAKGAMPIVSNSSQAVLYVDASDFKGVIRAVGDLLGHTSLSSTQIYTHIKPEKMKEIYKQSHPRGEK